jgi:hypothetical protein
MISTKECYDWLHKVCDESKCICEDDYMLEDKCIHTIASYALNEASEILFDAKRRIELLGEKV